LTLVLSDLYDNQVLRWKVFTQKLYCIPRSFSEYSQKVKS